MHDMGAQRQIASHTGSPKADIPSASHSGNEQSRGKAASTVAVDPSSFPPVVAGVARACDDMGSVAQAVPATPTHLSDAFGEAGAAWLAFHQAWSAEAATAHTALDEMTDVLPRATAKLQQVDHDSGAVLRNVWRK